jgi:hypothetical protein
MRCIRSSLVGIAALIAVSNAPAARAQLTIDMKQIRSIPGYAAGNGWPFFSMDERLV